MKCTTGDLHAMDLGTHIHLYHEWNEGTEGIWGEATVMRRHPHTIVIQPYMPTSPSATGEGEFIAIAVYRTQGEGELTELYFADRKNGVGWNYVGKGTKVPYEVQVKQHRIEQLEASLKVANDKVWKLEAKFDRALDVLQEHE